MQSARNTDIDLRQPTRLTKRLPLERSKPLLQEDLKELRAELNYLKVVLAQDKLEHYSEVLDGTLIKLGHIEAFVEKM